MINVYKASAGSGKTFTLVRQYFKLVMGIKNQDTGEYTLNKHIKDAHRSVLAITFTNKATDEMKQRIIKELFILSKTPDESGHLEFLMTELKASKEEIQEAATTVMNQILNDFTNFNVSTIDSFFQTILRTFARESDIAGNYNIELNDDYAIAVGISDLKQSLRTGSKADTNSLVEWLSDFMISKVEDGQSWNIFNDNKQSSKKGGGMTLNSFASNLSKEFVKKNRDKLNEYLSNRQNIKDFKTELIKKTNSLKETIVENATAIEKISSNIKFSSNFQKILTKAKGDIDFSSSATLKSFLETYNLESKWFNKKELAIAEKEGIIDPIRNKWEELKSCIVRIKSIKMILSQLYFLGLLGDIEANIRKYNTENNVILLSDTNEMLRKIINKDDAPFIYERVGVALSHYLIDEFQDTSKMQWDNIKPLIDNSLSESNDNLIIGDVKQSIYRFRNSDPKLLKDKIYTDFGRSINEPNKNDPKANTNWRSAPNVVKFNNSFFPIIAKNLELKEIYDNVTQQIASKNKDIQGHVKIETLEEKEDKSFKDIALDKMLEDILGLLDRNYQQKDITILVNKNDEGELVIQKLLDYSAKNPDGRKLDVISDESLRISKSPAVKIILGILSLLDNKASIKEKDEENANNKRKLPLIIKRINYNLSHEEDTSKAFHDAIISEDNDVDEDFLNGAQDCAGLDAIVERIIQKYIIKNIDGKEGDSEESKKITDTPYIQAFMDYVISYQQRFGSNLHMFLKWWGENEHKCTITSPDNINAIKVITIHKSKGLEFPCVIIPFANWTFDKENLEWMPGNILAPYFKNNTDIIPPIIPVKRTKVKDVQYTIFDNEFKAIEKESVMDSLNKTYVAFTRAINELIIYTGKAKNHSLFDEIENFEKKSTIQTTDIQINPQDFFKNGIFELGEPTVKTDKNEETAENAKSDKTADNYDKAEKENMPDYEVIAKSEAPGYRVQDQITYDREDPRFKGEILHKILSKVNVKSDLDFAIRYFLSKGLYTPDESAKFRQMLKDGFEKQKEKCSEWFAEGNKLIKERTIVNNRGEERRPDRIVITPDGKTIIVDYKFGKQQHNGYKRQVQNYMNVIRDCGYKNVEGYIWYVVEDEIIKI